jgi:hypothetical protein
LVDLVPIDVESWGDMRSVRTEKLHRQRGFSEEGV